LWRLLSGGGLCWLLTDRGLWWLLIDRGLWRLLNDGGLWWLLIGGGLRLLLGRKLASEAITTIQKRGLGWSKCRKHFCEYQTATHLEKTRCQ